MDSFLWLKRNLRVAAGQLLVNTCRISLWSGFRKACFCFLGGFGLYWDFGFFYLNEQLGSLLVDLGHQLSFYLDSPVLKILKLTSYWSLEAVNIKKSLIITSITN